MCLAVILFTVSILAQKQPDFSAPGMDGQTIETASLRGKVVVINLWYVNCPNCLEEMTELNKLVDQYKGNKEVVFLALAASKKPALEQFLKTHPFKYQIVPDATMIILTKFGTPDKNGDINVPFPMHYVLDREGNIVVKTQGIKGIDAVKKELEKQFSRKTGGSS